MLAAVTDGMVSRFEPDTDLRDLAEGDLELGVGYLIEFTPGGSGCFQLSLPGRLLRCHWARM